MDNNNEDNNWWTNPKIAPFWFRFIWLVIMVTIPIILIAINPMLFLLALGGYILYWIIKKASRDSRRD